MSRTSDNVLGKQQENTQEILFVRKSLFKWQDKAKDRYEKCLVDIVWFNIGCM